MEKGKLIGENFGIALVCLVVISMLLGLPGAINAGAAENSPISFGETLSGSIDMAAEMDTYTFSASADDTVLIRMTKTSGDMWAGIRLFAPDGTKLDEEESGTTAEISYTLPSGGSYTILAYDGFVGDGTGGYNIYLHRLSVGPEGSISGVVEDDEGNAIEGASVGAYASADFGQSAETDSEGQYTIYGLPSGWYWVEVEAAGFVGEWYDDAYGWPDAQPVEVIAPNDTPNINFTLEPGGSISGVVCNVDGSQTLPKMHVRAESVEGDWGKGTETEQDGSYILNLPYGEYKVYAESAPWTGGEQGYIKEYWQEKASEDGADIITICEGVNPTNIDFTLETGGSISGHVYEADENTPVEGARVDAHDYDTNEYICHVTTDENGFYVINGLAPGKYRLSASAKRHAREMYGGGRDWWAAPPVEVTAPHETTGINFALEPGGTVSGTVYDSEMHPLPDMAVKAIPVDGGPSVGDACTDEDGHYTTAGVPYGEYKVKAWPGWCGGDPRYQPEYWEEKSNWENADIVTVSEGEPNPTGIDFTLEIPTGSISGVVHYTGSISDSHQLWIIARRGQHRGHRHIDCTGPGNYAYTIPYVPDGTYIVAAILDSHDTGLEELVTDEPLAFYAGPVTVLGGGETSGIDITLADPAGSISGEIIYSGEMDSHSIIVTASAQPYTDALKWPVYYASLEEPGGYSFPTVADGSYYLNAWLDLNGNWEADSDEPSGEYPNKVVISGDSAATDIDIVLTAEPTIGFSPNSFSFSAAEGGANPADQTLEIWNSGSATLDWSISNDATWLILSPPTGSSAGEHDAVIVSVDISGMSANAYSATITISASGATNTPQTVPVDLTINPAGDEDNPDVATGLASLGDKLVVAYGYKAGEGVGGWTVYNPEWAVAHPEWNTLTTLYVQRGYWINVSEGCDLTYGANAYGLDAGWNLIGWVGW